MSFLTQRPLTASVTITKSGTNYFNSTTTNLNSTEFRLLGSIINLSSGNKAATITLEVEDNNEKWFSTFTVGASVAAAIGKLGSTYASVFVGTVEHTMLHRYDSNNSTLNIEATDLQQVLMNTMVLNFERHQERNTDGTVKTSDMVNMLVTDIIIHLMNSSDPAVYYNGVNSGITATSTGIKPNTGVAIPDVIFHYKPLHDCLKELFDYVRYDWGVDESGALFGRPVETATDSGVTLDTSTIIDLEIEDDITETKNVAFILGADQMVATGGILSPTSGVMNNSSLFLAQKFTAIADELAFAQAYIHKTGDPANLNCAVYSDDNNVPSNTAVIYASLDKNKISTTPGWSQFEVNQKVTTGKPYWIVLLAQKDASNYYNWHTNGAANASTATATDSLASTAATGGWSTVAATSAFIHNIWYSAPTIGFNIDKRSTSTFGVRQIAERQGDINEKVNADAWAMGLVNILGKKKQLLRIRAVMPNTILKPGKRVTVADVSLVTTSYIMTDCKYVLGSYESYFIDVSAMRFVAA